MVEFSPLVFSATRAVVGVTGACVAVAGRSMVVGVCVGNLMGVAVSLDKAVGVSVNTSATCWPAVGEAVAVAVGVAVGVTVAMVATGKASNPLVGVTNWAEIQPGCAGSGKATCSQVLSAVRPMSVM